MLAGCGEAAAQEKVTPCRTPRSNTAVDARQEGEDDKEGNRWLHQIGLVGSVLQGRNALLARDAAGLSIPARDGFLEWGLVRSGGQPR